MTKNEVKTQLLRDVKALQSLVGYLNEPSQDDDVILLDLHKLNFSFNNLLIIYDRAESK